MKLTPDELVRQLSPGLSAPLAEAAIASYVEMEQRFIAGDWKPAELDGGRLCEAISRCLYQLDAGIVSESQLPGEICTALRDAARQHRLGTKDRHHITRVIELVYKFRSDRGAVHISPLYTANFMDAMLILHGGKWMLAELLRLAWNQDRELVAQVIAQLVQVEHSLIHELDGKPLVLAKGISAPEEILLLLHHASSNRLTRLELRQYATNQKPQTLSVAISRLIRDKDIRTGSDGDIALTPNGKKRVMEEILPRLGPKS
jgi:hypothetical protein